MGIEGFIGRFEAARLVRKGQATEVDIRTEDGVSVLRKSPGQVKTPVVIAPVGWTGIALPDQMIEVVRGRYEGKPEPKVTLAVLRQGGSEEVLEVPRFALRASDLDRSVTIIERATNPHGSVKTEAVIEVSRLAPTEIIVTGLTDVTESTGLPVEIARLSADGTAPLDWSITQGGDGLAIDLTGATPVLRVVAMPTAGLQQVTIAASNAAGSTSVDIEFEVMRSVEPPHGISLSESIRDMSEEDALPVDLAELFCESSVPVSWSVPSGGERFVIDDSGDVPVLRMYSMPPLGSHVIDIKAANDGGAATAQFVLNVGPGGVATTQITQSPATAMVASDAVVPTLLSVLTADGTAPVTWSLLSGGDICALEVSGSQAMLRLIALPAAGETRVTIRATNAKGSAECDFALGVHAPVLAPKDLMLSVAAVTIVEDATLPRVLATLRVQGTAPIDWSLIDAEPYFDIDLSGDAPKLMLIEMPGEGRYPVEVAAANSAGAARATLDLTIAPAMTAPANVTMDPRAASISAEQALPVVLAVLGTDGPGEITWSVASGGTYCAIETQDGEARLVLVARPAAGLTPIEVEARNAAGMTRASFALTVRAPVTVAPSAVTLSASARTVQSSASLPIALAEAEADGTKPLSWRLTSGAPHVTLDTTGAKPVLRLVGMPVAGTTQIAVEASNGAGAATASFALDVQAPVVDALITVNRGTVKAQIRNGDGSVSFSIADSNHDGDYKISAEAMQDGLPTILVMPSIAVVGSTWTVGDDGLYAWPISDEASLLVQWEVERQKVGSGASFTRQSHQQDSGIEAVVRLINVASQVKGREITGRVPVQVPTIYPSKPVVYSSTSAQATLSLMGVAQPASMVVGFWGRISDPASAGNPLSGGVQGGGNNSLYIQMFDRTLRIGVPTLTAGVLNTPSEAFKVQTLTQGDRIFALLAIKPGSARQFCFSQNGTEWVRRSSGSMAAGATFALNIPALTVHSGWNCIRDRLAIWGPATLPDFDNPVVQGELLDLGGRPKDPARANAILGVPLLDDRGAAADFNAGKYAGLWNNGAWTITRPAVDYQE